MKQPLFLRPRTLAVCLALLPVAFSYGETTPQPAAKVAIADMATAAKNFLNILDDAQRAKAVFTLTDDERQNWHFVPMDRKGITLAAQHFLKTYLLQLQCMSLIQKKLSRYK